MATLYHQVWINAPVAKVYEATSTADGLGKWWAPHTSIETDAGLVVAHNPGKEHGEVRMKLLDRVQDRRAEWEIISTHPKRSPASAWTGTHIAFEIAERERTRDFGSESVLARRGWRYWTSATPAGMSTASISDSATSPGARRC